MSDREAWIIDGVRTYRGKGRANGALHHIHPQELLAQCLNAVVGRTGVATTDIEDVITGNAAGVGDHGGDIARLAVLTAGWPYSTPGLTINRFCGSGQQAVGMAATGILAGHQDLVIGSGVESMSRPFTAGGDGVPGTMDGGNPHVREKYPLIPQGISADLIATVEGFSRTDCDELAVMSQDRAAKAIAEGRFDRSVITVLNDDGSIALDHEEFPRPGTTVEGLAGLAASFAEMGATPWDKFGGETFDEMCMRTYPQIDAVDHVHHAGNSSGVVDGASAILVASSDYARANGLTPRARIRMTAAVGSEPVIMLTGPAPAAQRCLDKAGMSVGDIDIWEINEAFAAVVLKAIRELGLDIDSLNVNGGAMALGHPIGGTGPMLIQTALDELERTDKETALIAMCTGGGMGTATIIERI
ncbi:MAG: acetyl-CoA C-acetyltransferase [Ilumatobacteraceae bacterium]